MTIESYLRLLIVLIPNYIFLFLFGTFFFGTILFFSWKGKREGALYTTRLALVEIFFFIYCSTLIYRYSHLDYRYEYRPLWSYGAILNGDSFLLRETIMNVAIFIPVGLLLGIGYSKKKWWKLIGIGCLFSISIEVLQFVTKRGYSETDDVIHNTLGCLLGYCLYIVLKQIYKIIDVKDLK